MRYYKYLNENIDNILKNNKLFQEYITNGDMLLYRAVNKDISNYEVFNRRKDRKPRDMPVILHNIFNSLFYKYFGWKARSEGVFVTSDISGLSQYGSKYLFIPLDPYSFIYSEKINDLLDIIDHPKMYFKPTEWELISPIIYDKTFNDNNKIEKIYKLLESKFIKLYHDKDIKKAIKSESEIMFNCDKYILMNLTYFKDNFYKDTK